MLNINKNKIMKDLFKPKLIAGKTLEELNEFNHKKLAAIEGGLTTGYKHDQNGTGLFGMDPKVKSELSRQNAVKANETNKKNGTSVYGMTFEERSVNGKKANQTNKNNKTALYGMSSEEKAKAAKKLVTSALESGNHNSYKLKANAIKQYNQILSLLPETFTNKVLVKILEENNIKAHNSTTYRKYWLKENQIVCIHPGKKGCNYDIAIYQKNETLS